MDRLPLALFAAVAVLIGADVAADLSGGTQPAHVALEGVVMLLACTGVLVMGRRLLAERSELRSALVRAEHTAALAAHDSARAHEQASKWKAEAQDALAGLSVAIDRQFERWSLSPAEREVGLLLLKGLSHKEIGTVLDKSDRTVRQQSLAIYKKSGLAGRAELSAFFLEDLLMPAATSTTPA